MNTEYICPTPIKWSEIHKSLDAFWKESGNQGIPPPIPLILGGWSFSNDYEKKDRWLQTISWAKANKCDKLISPLKENEIYAVHEPSSYIPYQHSNWNKEPRVKPSQKEIEEYLKELKAKWVNVLSDEFGIATKPIQFSGSKLRRLVVSYKNEYKPPWGSWTNSLASGSPSKFTILRKNINSIIKPHEVDHVDFIVEPKSRVKTCNKT